MADLDGLAILRKAKEVLPEAEQGISYGMPAFKVRGKVIAGFESHLSYLPHSGSVFPQLTEELKATQPRRGHCTSTSTARCLRPWSRS